MKQASGIEQWNKAYENVFRAVNQRNPRPELGRGAGP